jgi:radical SAM protein with 4Fe4S-binding SPASM domain
MAFFLLNRGRKRAFVKESNQELYNRLIELKTRAPWRQWPDHFQRALHHSARQRAEEQIAPDFPPILYIEPTNACNCNCRICPRQKMTRPVGRMDMALYRQIIDSAAALGPSEIHLFNFGEPVLHPELHEMVRYAGQNGLKALFQTNGLIIDEAQIRRLLEAGLRYIGVSVNGLTPQEYEAIRPGHSFQRLYSNLTRLRQIIDDSGRPCTLHFVAQILKEEAEDRATDIESFKQTWFAIADSLSIFGLSAYAGVSLRRQGQETESHHLASSRKTDESLCCTEPFDRLVIKWDGRVTICCVDYDARMVVGDLRRQSLTEVWNSPTLNLIRDTIRQRQYSRLPLCRDCPKFYSEPFTLFMQKTHH